MDSQKWAAFYRSDPSNTRQVFIKVMTTDGKHFFLPVSPDGQFTGWMEDVKDHCAKNSVFIQDLHLQFRTNRCIIDVENADALYLVRSVLGALGQQTQNFITVGVMRGDELTKSMYRVPELIKEKEYLDTLDNCFDEAMIYNEKTQANRKEQVQT